jgi:hypothetical protein
MILSNRTLEILADFITEQTEYRSGPQLVKFFNTLGSHDVYASGFPTRSKYALEKVTQLNGTPEMDKCIKNLFAPVNFVNRLDALKSLIASFNKYLMFDGWNVVWKGKEITFQKADSSHIEDLQRNTESVAKENLSEDEFLAQTFEQIKWEHLGIGEPFLSVLQERVHEIELCMKHDIPLSAIFLCGSTLEGIFLWLATSKFQKDFNTAESSPKDSKASKVLPFHQWSLSSFIDVAYELGFIKLDMKKFSHDIRDFRNYIHPHQQLSSQFSPDARTVKISYQVLLGVIDQMSKVIILNNQKQP